MKQLAIVTPWFGKDLKGKMEQQAWQIAVFLADRGHAVEVITTCCRSFDDDWAVNYFTPGLTKENGLDISRFQVEQRDKDAFDRVDGLMLGLSPSELKPGVNPINIDDAKIICSQNINSTQLIKYLEKNYSQYQSVLFIPYFYSPILNGLSVVFSRFFLQPCLHNEAYAYLPQVASMFHDAKGLLFASEGEYQLARKLYGPGITTKSMVIGAGQTRMNESTRLELVIERYESILGLSKSTVITAPRRKLPKLTELHQILPSLAYGDAISNHTLAIRDYLRSCGHKSDIFVRYLDEKIVHEAKVFNPKYINSQAGLIYHHSIGSEITDYVATHSGPKCLIYHNITPPTFFQPYKPEFANILEKGLTDLGRLAPYFPLSVGDSTFNANELLASGFSNPGVLPIAIDCKQWDMPADDELMQKLQDGKSNLLFVGRLAPNKRQDHLLEAFAHYRVMDREARLILVGCIDTNDPYYFHILNTIARLDLTEHVIVAGQSTDAQLLAFYRTAHLFWSMSEHEGFCVPLIESMWFDIPILAYKSSAIPETLGKAGIIFTTKENLIQVAILARIMVEDKTLRSKIINAQQQRRNDFLPRLVHSQIDELVSKMQEM